MGFCIYPGDKIPNNDRDFGDILGFFSYDLKRKFTVSNPRYRDLGSRKNPILKAIYVLVILLINGSSVIKNFYVKFQSLNNLRLRN